MQAGLSTKNAPSVWVVVPHFLLGTLSFIIAAVILSFNSETLLGYHLGGPVLAVAHLMILGWVTMIIFGALYQLIPVVMEVKLYSENLAFISLVSLVIGLFFLIIAFFGFTFQLTNNFMIGGSLVVFAVLLFAINSIKSALSSPKNSISKSYIMASTIYLLMTVLLGLFTIINLSGNYMVIAHTELLKIHAVIGLAGWFLMLIIGVASKLIPMFLIVHKTKETYIKAGFYIINAAIIILFINTMFSIKSIIVETSSYVLILVGLLLFMLYNLDLFKRRLRKKLDIGMQLTAIGLVVFILTLISFVGLYFGSLTLGLPIGRMEIISGLLLVYGFFTGLILGQTYKTLPFIIWLYNYQALVGRQKTPLPADLYSDKLAAWHMYTFVISLVLFIVGLLFSIKLLLMIASVFMVITSLIYAYNVFQMIFHKKKTI